MKIAPALCVLIPWALILTLSMGEESFSRSYSSSRSSSSSYSSRSSSSSSRSYSRPSSSSSRSSYSSSRTSPKVQSSSTASSSSSKSSNMKREMGQKAKAQKAKAAKNAAAGKQERNNFSTATTPRSPNPTARKARPWKQRERQYQENPYYNNYTPPVYAQQSSPSFGAMDAMFMWMMLDNVASGSRAPDTFYHKQNDPDFQAWRKEAETLAKDNEELKKKLESLDKSMEEIKKEGTPVDPGFQPKDAEHMKVKPETQAGPEEKAEVLLQKQSDEEGSYLEFGLGPLFFVLVLALIAIKA